MKGERPAELVGLARTMRARGVPHRRRGRRRRHLRHRRRPLGHLQHLDRRGARGRRRRPARRQARQPLGVEPLRQRRRARGARRHGRPRRRPWSSARSREAGIGVLLRADLPSGDAPRRRGAPGARRADGVQPARAADQPGPGALPGRRRGPPGADRADGPGPAAARRPPRLGRARRRRPRRAVDHRLLPRCPSATARSCAPSTCTRPMSACRRRRCRRCSAATPPTTPRIIRGVLAGQVGPARDVVLLNAGAALFVAGRAASLRQGIAQRRRGDRRRARRPRVVGACATSPGARHDGGDPGSARGHRRGDPARPAGPAGARRRTRRWSRRPGTRRRRAGGVRRGAAPARRRQRHRRVQAPIAVARRAAARPTTRRRRPGPTRAAAPSRSRC